jgi:hypothetical protein
LFVNISLACKPNTKATIYDCKNDLDKKIAKQANMEVSNRMKECPDCCIKKTSEMIAEKHGCQVKMSDGDKKSK